MIGEVAPQMQIFVRTLTGRTITLDCTMDSKISELCKQIEGKQNIPANNQKLIYAGRTLRADTSLKDNNIGKEATLHLVVSIS